MASVSYVTVFDPSVIFEHDANLFPLTDYTLRLGLGRTEWTRARTERKLLLLPALF